MRVLADLRIGVQSLSTLPSLASWAYPSEPDDVDVSYLPLTYMSISEHQLINVVLSK